MIARGEGTKESVSRLLEGKMLMLNRVESGRLRVSTRLKGEGWVNSNNPRISFLVETP